MSTEPLAVARRLVELGVPIFRATPCPGPGCTWSKCQRPEFHYPNGWQTTFVGSMVGVESWKPGDALCAVMGTAFDGLDFDPRVEGAIEGPVASILSYGMAQTPSGGWHKLIAPLGIGKKNEHHHGFPGIDLQGGAEDAQSRGFLFIAPTVRASKVDGIPRQYQWIVEPTPVQAWGDDSGEWLGRLIDDRARNARLNRATGTIAPDNLSDQERERIEEHYLPSALPAIIDAYEQAAPFTGDTAGFACLARLYELANAGWNSLTREEAEARFYAAAERRRARCAAAGRPDGGQSTQDVTRLMRQASKHTGDKVAAFPPSRGNELLDNIQRRTEATKTEALGQDQELPPTEDNVSMLIGEMLDTFGIEAIPDPEWLIKEWLTVDATASVIGHSGHMKSFVALDIACHVALGLPWHGYKVNGGLVVYVVAEGAAGIKRRVRAWEQYYGKRATGLLILPRPIQAAGPEWAVLVEAMKIKQPRLFIVDTQARVTVGMEESSATDIGMFVEQMERVRRATGCCAMVVHHLGKAGLDAGGRGSSAARAAWTSEISVVMEEDGMIKIASSKQKDSPDDLVHQFKPVTIELGEDEEGDPITSLILLDLTDTARELARGTVTLRLKEIIVEVANEWYLRGEEFTRTQLQTNVRERLPGTSRANYFKVFKSMVEAGILEPTGKIGVASRFKFVSVAERSLQDQSPPVSSDIDRSP